VELQKSGNPVDARPADVPAAAIWNDEENEWELGNTVNGLKVGAWKWWAAPDGYLVCESEFDPQGELVSYVRFHPDGSVARQGAYLDGKEHGTTICYRCKMETPEFFPPRAGEMVWRTESDFVEGVIHEERYFLEDGTQVNQEGVPLNPTRKGSVHPQAVWNEESGEWEYGQRDSEGRMTGKWFAWGHEGHLCSAAIYKTDWLQQQHRFHPDGTVSLAEKYQETGGVPVYKMVQRSRNRPGHEHHAATSSVRRVVDRAVTVGREASRRDRVDVDAPGLPSFGEQTVVQYLEELRKEGDDFEPHQFRLCSGISFKSLRCTSPASRSTRSSHFGSIGTSM